MTKPRFEVFIIDDHTLFRSGLRNLLEYDSDYTVTGEGSTGAELFELLETTVPDVILLDIDMPVMNGMQAAEKLMKEYPDLKVITLSMHGDEDYYFKMVSLGVKGFLLKNSEMDELKMAINTVIEGGSYFSQELLRSLVGSLKTKKQPAVDEEALSHRELEILLLICQGLSNHEIADQLFISKRTVDKHRANILAKTSCKNTANLVVYAIKNSLVEI